MFTYLLLLTDFQGCNLQMGTNISRKQKQNY